VVYYQPVLSADCLPNSSGRFEASLRTDSVYPGRYALAFRAKINLAHSEYQLDLWDSAVISLHPFTGENGTTLKGRLLTAHGLPVDRASVTVSVNGRLEASLTPDESGGFACQLDLRPGKHTIAASFPGVPFVEPCETVITYDPSLFYWKVVLEQPAARIILPEQLIVLTVRAEGTPPYRDLALTFTATAVETGRPSRLQVAPAGASGRQREENGEVTSVTLQAPPRYGPGGRVCVPIRPVVEAFGGRIAGRTRPD